MGGPIVRTGTTPEFWKNWDQVFGDKKKAKKTSASKAGKNVVKKSKKSKARKKN